MAIDRQAKQVQVKGPRHRQGCTPKATISWCWPRGPNAVVPRIPGIAEASLFTVKTVDDVARLHSFLQQQSARRVSVIGGGFIGHRGGGQPAGDRL